MRRDDEAERQHRKNGSGTRNWTVVILRENQKTSASTKLHLQVWGFVLFGWVFLNKLDLSFSLSEYLGEEKG